ncbi:Basic helix-loop-helix DNA-binding superfamily protein [Tripterygium wilfordii]|uniref:Basic helix-loop-helix DNA-binding superfamily protein n=1 Tax=Tripterygium wilfordii TaxID=458696 RepID=A0A7J7CAQ4_TRIWF|nr:transcription factor SPEECHLESS-like [Tripterygium wilfordii]KAF5731228.1 Basic helix-loop-helix DNA-binding superfamily protein [Tripterygium wilfordii]
MGDSFSDFFDDPELAEDDLLSIFESLESFEQFPPVTPSEEINQVVGRLESETELEGGSISPKSKRQKVAGNLDKEGNYQDGEQRMSHITVERNRRKQMSENLSVLRSLMPCFYVKRGDQASIIGGVVDYINELQQILQSLEAKKQRKVYNEVLSPRIVSSPRVPSVPLSPRKPPLSPRLNLPMSPRTPTPTSPYRPRLQPPAAAAGYNLSPTTISGPNSFLGLEPSPTSSSSSSSIENELVANSKSAIADVDVKFSGPNLVLKTVSHRIPGQAVKIISALEDLSLEILDININTVDETLLNSFTIKIGIECQLSAEELAQQIQQTFC